MLYRNEFRNRKDIKRLADAIKSCHIPDINIMEVCGTHTMAIASSGIKQLLPSNITLISGPGCPVCVTPSERINDIYRLSKNRNVIIATYGDMLRVPGTRKDISLDRSRMDGGNIRIVYSSMDAFNVALDNPHKEVVFLGVGFETTTPATGIAIKEAVSMGVKNFSVFCMHKTMEMVMRKLLDSKEVKIDGFLLPGHVSVIIGKNGFGFLEKYNVPGVISGFEPSDILKSIYMISKQVENKVGRVENEYTRLVYTEGNMAAKAIINEIFEPYDDMWRGIGKIEHSGLKIKDEFKEYDAAVKFGIQYTEEIKKTPCRCGDVIKGLIEPCKCPLFGNECVPDSPVGPCMVSSEGSCAAAYKYR